MAKKKKGLIEQLKALIGLEKEPELMTFILMVGLLIT